MHCMLYNLVFIVSSLNKQTYACSDYTVEQILPVPMENGRMIW